MIEDLTNIKKRARELTGLKSQIRHLPLYLHERGTCEDGTEGGWCATCRKDAPGAKVPPFSDRMAN